VSARRAGNLPATAPGPWLSWTLIADSMISPCGSGIVFTAANACNVFGLAKNGFFPGSLVALNRAT
jgi:amino acid transporter